MADMTSAVITSSPGRDLRAARERLGISRARLAGLADVSLASLDRIEQGACPRRSRVLSQAWAALAAINATPVNDADRGAHPGPLKEEADAGDLSPTRAA
jgi:transcriptional regulator with XRE-family HTH domain